MLLFSGYSIAAQSADSFTKQSPIIISPSSKDGIVEAIEIKEHKIKNENTSLEEKKNEIKTEHLDNKPIVDTNIIKPKKQSLEEINNMTLKSKAIKKVNIIEVHDQAPNDINTNNKATQDTVVYNNAAGKEGERFPFIGIVGSYNTSVVGSGLTDTNDKTFGIRYGQQTIDWRGMLTYEFKMDGLETVGIEVDRIISDTVFGSPKFRSYIGLSLGKLDYDSNEIEDITSGFYFGINGGFILYSTDVLDIDISYHSYKVQDIEGLDSIKGGNVALHYFF